MPCTSCANPPQGRLSISHHYSGPNYDFPRGDARLDLTDLYALPKPGDVGKSILIMNVHPSIGVAPPEPTTDKPFAPDAVYEICIDTDGDAVADIAYRVRFSPFEGGAQTASWRRVEGAAATTTGGSGRTIIENAPVSMRRDARIAASGNTGPSPVGAAIPSALTRRALPTACGLPALIFLPKRTLQRRAGGA